MKKFALATACLVMLVIATTGAWANATGPQITLSKGNVGYYSFWNPGPAIDFSLTGTTCGHPNCVSGAGALDDGNGNLTVGKYSMWLNNGPAYLTGGPIDFTAVMGTSTLWLNFSLNGGLGSVKGTVVLTDLTGGATSTPKFDGMFTISSSSGMLSMLYPVGTTAPLDFTVNLSPATTFAPRHNGPTIFGYVSSGEIPAVPEPGTLALMGTGVLGLASVIRRRMMK
jgi:hypothetical protein